MKKSMILAAMLSIGYAAAQTTNNYDERVGINTDTPSATLNVKTKNNTTSPKNLELENASGTKLMTVLNSGNVGINTTSPVGALHIVSPNRGFGNDIVLEDYTTTQRDPSAIIFNRNRGTAAAPLILQQDDNIGQIIFGTKEGRVNGNLTGATARNAEIGADYTTEGKGVFYIKTSGDHKRVSVLDTGEVKVHNLIGTGDRIVMADANGILKTGTISTGLTSEVDGIIGNEVTDATANGGLVRSGSGTASSPYTLGLPAGTAVGQTMVWNGTAWEVKAPEAGGTLQALTGKIVERASINATDWKVEGIFALVQTSNATINLPNPADFTNKIISVSNGTGYQLNYNGTHSPNIASTLASGKGHILMSNGTTWFIIGGSY